MTTWVTWVECHLGLRPLQYVEHVELWQMVPKMTINFHIAMGITTWEFKSCFNHQACRFHRLFSRYIMGCSKPRNISNLNSNPFTGPRQIVEFSQSSSGASYYPFIYEHITRIIWIVPYNYQSNCSCRKASLFSWHKANVALYSLCFISCQFRSDLRPDHLDRSILWRAC